MTASVTRNGETRRLVTSSPLTAPTAMPKRMQTRKITGIIALLVAPKAVATTAAVAMFEATERSSPRTSRAKACPSTTMPRGAAWVSRFCRLLGLRKLGVASDATTSSSTEKATSP